MVMEKSDINIKEGEGPKDLLVMNIDEMREIKRSDPEKHRLILEQRHEQLKKLRKQEKKEYNRIAKNMAQRQYNKNHPEKVAEWMKKYYQKNKEKIRKYSKLYYQKNKEEISKKGKLYWLKNKDVINTRARKRYHAHAKKLIMEGLLKK